MKFKCPFFTNVPFTPPRLGRFAVAIRYEHVIMFIRLVGTHQEYERIDAAKV
jgi:hypothetical protein